MTLQPIKLKNRLKAVREPRSAEELAGATVLAAESKRDEKLANGVK